MTRSPYLAPDLRRTRLADALADNAAIRAELAAALAEVERLALISGWIETAARRTRARYHHPELSFGDKVQISDETDCWQWSGALTGGYGRMYVRGVQVFAHRWSYERFVGPIPAGLQVDHLCRNRACTNPTHLEPVTSKENTLRGMSPSAVHARMTKCHQGHDYTEANTRWVRRPELSSGVARACILCERARSKRSHDAARARRAAAK